MKDCESVLIIEDDPKLARLLHRALSPYDLACARGADDALPLAARLQPDLILLGLSCADWHGTLTLCSQLRSAGQTPIIVLSAAPSSASIVEAFESGADDCIGLPFDADELCARLRARLRRPSLEASRALDYASGPSLLHSEDDYLQLHVERRQIFAGAREIRLSKTEFAILYLLMLHAGKVLTHRWLLREVWGPAYGAETGYLRVFVRHLRRKVEPVPDSPSYILTENGIGYVFRS